MWLFVKSQIGFWLNHKGRMRTTSITDTQKFNEIPFDSDS